MTAPIAPQSYQQLSQPLLHPVVLCDGRINRARLQYLELAPYLSTTARHYRIIQCAIENDIFSKYAS